MQGDIQKAIVLNNKVLDDYRYNRSTGVAEALTKAKHQYLAEYVAEKDGLLKKYGKLKKNQVLGIIPARIFKAFALLEFERKTIGITYFWAKQKDGKVVLAGSLPEKSRYITKIFGQKAKDEFINYHFFSHKVTSIRLLRINGKVTGLQIAGQTAKKLNRWNK